MKQDRGDPWKTLKTIWVRGIQTEKQEGSDGSEQKESCWPRKRFQLGPKNNEEATGGF